MYFLLEKYFYFHHLSKNTRRIRDEGPILRLRTNQRMCVGGESEKVNLFLKFSNLYFSQCPPPFSFVPCPKNFPWEPERARVSFPFVFASLRGRKDTFPRFSLFSVSVGSGRKRAVARTRTVPNSGSVSFSPRVCARGYAFEKGGKFYSLLTSGSWPAAVLRFGARSSLVRRFPAGRWATAYYASALTEFGVAEWTGGNFPPCFARLKRARCEFKVNFLVGKFG